MVCNSAAPRLNLKPYSWGNSSWLFLYSIALTYPNDPTPIERQAARDMLESLQYLLPCEKCRVNFSEKLNGWVGERIDGDALDCSENFMQLIHDLEASVAALNGKTIPSFNDTKRSLMAGKYLRQASAAAAASTSTSTTSGSNTALWITLPLAIAVAIVITWAITRAVLIKR